VRPHKAAIDTTTAGRLLCHVLAAISEFERDLIRDRVLAGLKRAKAQGVRLGGGLGPSWTCFGRRAMLADGKSLRQVAKALHVALATLARAVPKTPGGGARLSARQTAGA
jgi:DNA invertase Pin-like site-specific DNA recombinase